MMMVFSWLALVASAALCGAALASAIDGFNGEDASTKRTNRLVAAGVCAVFALFGGEILALCGLDTVNLVLALTMPVLMPAVALILFGLYQLVCGAGAMFSRWLDQLSELAGSIGTSFRNRNRDSDKE
ncbi:MAG: hypothetical protein K2W95_35800 [Candidatus Obscuribacterales bacterium]|nr:hypothetical protein [Candidatus Obscuribacterales bacterium]